MACACSYLVRVPVRGLCAGVERGGDVLCAAGRVWSVTALKDSNGMPDTPSQARVGEDKLSHNTDSRLVLPLMSCVFE